MLPLSAVGRSSVSVTAIAKHCTCCLAAAPWQPRACRCAAAGTRLCRSWAAVGGNREPTLPPGTRPCFTLQKYCLMREKKKSPKPVFLFACVSVVTPYLDLHLSQQILRNFSSVHVSGVELKKHGATNPGQFPCAFSPGWGCAWERGGYEHSMYLDNLPITTASLGVLP